MGRFIVSWLTSQILDYLHTRLLKSRWHNHGIKNGFIISDFASNRITIWINFFLFCMGSDFVLFRREGDQSVDLELLLDGSG